MENVNYSNYSMSLKIRQQSKFFTVMNMSKPELFHRYGIPSYPRTDSSATPLEKPRNFNVIPHINTTVPNCMAYGYMTFLFYVTRQVCTMLYYIYQHLLHVLYQQYTWPVTK